nr:hypothetical protein [Tanacetum cinerariifolium]
MEKWTRNREFHKLHRGGGGQSATHNPTTAAAAAGKVVAVVVVSAMVVASRDAVAVGVVGGAWRGVVMGGGGVVCFVSCSFGWPENNTDDRYLVGHGRLPLGLRLGSGNLKPLHDTMGWSSGLSTWYEGVLTESTGTAGAGESSLLTRGGFRHQKCRSGSCTELHRSHWLRQLIELDVNSFHDTSGSFVVDFITLPAWCITNGNSYISYWFQFAKIFAVICRITEGTKDTEKVATASAQRNIGALENISIVLAASTRVQFCLSTMPFCCGVLETDF